jgi:hypothetical protein
MTLQIDGRLDTSNVEALGEACEELREAGEDMSGPMKLDLSNLLSADEIGLSAILGLLDGGAELVGANPYFKLLLDMKRTARERSARRGPPAHKAPAD